MPLPRSIQSRFRKAIRKCHPDGVPREFEEAAEKITKQLNSARDAEDREGILPLLALVESGAFLVADPPDSDFRTEFGLKMIKIKPGHFTMGSPDGKGFCPHGPEMPRRVNITKPFWMSQTAVTQRQFNRVMGTKCPRRRSDLNNHPVTNVTWNQVRDFCRRATMQSPYSDWLRFQLSTEAQWEYACRAGTTTLFSGEPLEDFAWFSENSDGGTHPVAKKKANPWKLYDMHGNVFEWCSDFYGKYTERDPDDDPEGPECGNYKIFRGGSWRSNAEGCHSDDRHWGPLDYKADDLGFRIVAVPK